jgi:hypothetical protein
LLVPLLLPELGAFDVLPEELPPVLPDVPLLPLDPMLPPEEPEELEPDDALEPCAAFHSERLIWPSWFLSIWSNDSLPLELDEPPFEDELPPEAALFCDDESDEEEPEAPDAPEDEGLLLLLCDMDGDCLLLLDCFDVSFA